MKHTPILSKLSKPISIILCLISLIMLCSIKHNTIISVHNSHFAPATYEPFNDTVQLYGNSNTNQNANGNNDTTQLNPESAKIPGSLHALSACLMDASSGRILYGKGETTPLAMASTTKIMTCIIALENGKLTDTVTVSKYASTMPDVQLNICEGEQYLLGDLLYSLMLESHNDTAVAIAEHIGGSVEGFAALMNEKATAIGCTDTLFVTPNGLDKDNHHSTAKDLCLIAAYAVKNSAFCDIIKTSSHSFSETTGKRRFTVNNKDAFLTSYNGAIGIKTGFTGKAGYCFVGGAQKNGMTLVSSVLASGWPPNKSYKWSDTKKLMDYGFNHYTSFPIIDGIIQTGAIAVIDSFGRRAGYTKEITTSFEAHFSYPLCETDNVTVKYNLPKSLTAPVNKGDNIGSAVVHLNGAPIMEIPIQSEVSVAKYNYHDIIKFVLEMFTI